MEPSNSSLCSTVPPRATRRPQPNIVEVILHFDAWKWTIGLVRQAKSVQPCAPIEPNAVFLDGTTSGLYFPLPVTDLVPMEIFDGKNPSRRSAGSRTAYQAVRSKAVGNPIQWCQRSSKEDPIWVLTHAMRHLQSHGDLPNMSKR
jgi:hypothetical protein